MSKPDRGEKTRSKWLGPLQEKHEGSAGASIIHMHVSILYAGLNGDLDMTGIVEEGNVVQQ